MFQIIIHDITAAFIEYIPYAAATGVLFICLIWILKSLIVRRTSDTAFLKWKRLTLLYVLYLYFFITIAITLLSREPGSRKELNLKLFSTILSSQNNNVYPAENILLFIPFGFLLPLLWNKFRNVFFCLLAGLIFSLSIEAIQYATQRGYTQIDDVIMNVFGTMIGYSVVSFIMAAANIWRKRRHRE
jgi:glycopeptide antibiotics resistance protein